MKLIALIDMDGSLVDYDKSMKDNLEAIRGPNEPIWDDNAPNMKARRRLIKNQPGFWKNMPVIQFGIDVVNMLRDAGFSLHVLTKGPRKISAAWEEKLDWVKENIPDAKMTITEDKSLVYGAILYDDWPEYIEPWLEWRQRGLVIMLDQPWNQGFSHPNVFRFMKHTDPLLYNQQCSDLKFLINKRKDAGTE